MTRSFQVVVENRTASMRAVRALCVLALTCLQSQEVEARRRAVRPPLPLVTVSAIEPGIAPIAGQTSHTIRGSGFLAGDMRVFFGDQPAMAVTYVSAYELRVVAPPHANGYVPLRVVNAGRSAVVQFLYTPPLLDSIATGAITTVAGIGQYFAEGGDARAAPFEVNGDIAVDSDGTVLVAERNRYVVRTIAPAGTVGHLAGRSVPLSPIEAAAGQIGDGGPATSAAAPTMGMAVGPDGNFYLAVTFEHRIRRVDRGSGIITTVAGSGPLTFEGAFAGDGGPATEARLSQPNQVLFDRDGNMFILDAFNYRVRRVSPDGVISTVAGNGTRGFSGDGGPATLASFNIGPNGDTGALKIDNTGNLYLADFENRRIRRVDRSSGIITTIAGGGTRQGEGFPATELNGAVAGIAVAPDGTTYFSDGNQIRRIETDGTVRTMFGEATSGFSDDGARSGRLSGPGRMEVDARGNRLLFTEAGTSRIRAIDLAMWTLSTIGGIGPAAFGENGPAVGAELGLTQLSDVPMGVTPDGGLLIGDVRRLRKLDRDGILRTIAGGGLNIHGTAPARRPALGTPLGVTGIAVATNGDIYLTANLFEVGRIVADGTYDRIAGGSFGYGGDGGPAAAALLDNPAGIAIDPTGNLFIADNYNHCIRRIDAQTSIITTFAGKSPPHPPNVWIPNRSSGDGGRAIDAELHSPVSVATDSLGNLYVIDNSGLRMVDRNGIINTVLRANPMQCTPTLVTSDRLGRVFVRCFNGEIRRYDGREANTVIGRTHPTEGFGGDGGPSAQAQTRTINAIAVDGPGNVYLFDSGNRRVRAIRGIAK